MQIQAIVLFLKKYRKFILPAICLLILFLYWNGRSNKISSLEERVINLSTENRLLETKYKEDTTNLKNDIEDQNEKISKMNRDYDTLSSELTKKIEEAGTINESLKQDLDEKVELINEIEPLTCQSGIELMVRLALSHKWSEEE